MSGFASGAATIRGRLTGSAFGAMLRDPDGPITVTLDDLPGGEVIVSAQMEGGLVQLFNASWLPQKDRDVLRELIEAFNELQQERRS